MEKTGSIDERIVEAVALINAGRSIIMTEGQEAQGRKLLVAGFSGALQAFQDTEASKEPKVVISSELVFLKQELDYCDKADTLIINSLKSAITSFEDAMRCLQTVESVTVYRFIEMSYPTTEKYRVQNLPKDAFHIACSSHRTRIQNSMRTPGLNIQEKLLYQQRAANMVSVKGVYIEKQRSALGLEIQE